MCSSTWINRSSCSWTSSGRQLLEPRELGPKSRWWMRTHNSNGRKSTVCKCREFWAPKAEASCCFKVVLSGWGILGCPFGLLGETGSIAAVRQLNERDRKSPWIHAVKLNSSEALEFSTTHLDSSSSRETSQTSGQTRKVARLLWWHLCLWLELAQTMIRWNKQPQPSCTLVEDNQILRTRWRKLLWWRRCQVKRGEGGDRHW